jgi:hypothetical protein
MREVLERDRLVISVAVHLTGLNVAVYYIPSILKLSGFGASATALGAVWVAAVNVVMTVIAMVTVDRLSRRPLFIGGLLTMASAASALGVLYALGVGHSIWPTVLFAVFLAAGAIGPAGVFWLYIAEIYPQRVRTAAMSLVTPGALERRLPDRFHVSAAGCRYINKRDALVLCGTVSTNSRILFPLDDRNSRRRPRLHRRAITSGQQTANSYVVHTIAIGNRMDDSASTARVLLDDLVPYEDFAALIFDCDGTLVDTVEAHCIAWRNAFAEYGIQMTPAWYQERIALSADDLIAAMEQHVAAG